MAETSKFGAPITPPTRSAVEQRLLQEIEQLPSPYDSDFASLHKTFAPFLQTLNPGNPRTIAYVDPLKYADATALGIDGGDYLSYALGRQGLKPGFFDRYSLKGALETKDGRLRFREVDSDAPETQSIEATGRNKRGFAIVPQDQISLQLIDVKGLTPQQLATYVNYHETFHAMNDVYNKSNDVIHAPQQRERFADVGAAIEMIRQGADPSLIDKVMDWRQRTAEATHDTVAALQGLKDYIGKNGVAGIRAMSDKQVLDLDYQITTATESSFLGMGWDHFTRDMSLPRLVHGLSDLYLQHDKDITPKGWDPAKELEQKALAQGGKVTPLTLIQANRALQAEYKAKAEADPNNPLYSQMMIKTQDAYARELKSADYAGLNAKHGAKLTDEDKEEIAFVQGKPIPTPAPAPAAAPKASQPKAAPASAA